MGSRRRRKIGGSRFGMSLVEMMVVLAIIAVLLALILPAIFSARRAARRSACTSNLRQLGVALQTYESSHSTFPPAHGLYNLYGVTSLGYYGKDYSAHVHLLPNLGQETLYDLVNFDMELRDFKHPSFAINSTAGLTDVGMFFCPGDTGRSPLGGNNYRVNLGTGPVWKGTEYGDSKDGVFGIFRSMRTGDITDGLAFSIAMSEKLRGDFDGSYFAPASDAAWTPLGDEVQSFKRWCEQLGPSAQAHFSNAGASWLISDTRYTMYNHTLNPNSVISDCGKEITYPSLGAFAARSNHGGGVNCLFADGAVRWVADAVDGGVWRALGTRSGGEKISGDAF